MLQQYGNFGDFLQRTSEHPPLIANLPIETGNMLQKWEVKHPSVRSLPRFPAPRQLDRLCPMLHAFRRGKQRGHSICHLPQWSHSRQRSHGNYSVIRFTPGRSWQILADPGRSCQPSFFKLCVYQSQEKICATFGSISGSRWETNGKSVPKDL